MYQAGVLRCAVVFAMSWESARGCRRKRTQRRNTEGTSRYSLTVYSRQSPICAVGSLTDVALRLADQPGPTRYRGHFEVVSLSGYLAAHELHLHMAVSDETGRTLGGHIMDGNVVYTTLVVVIQEYLRYRYRREFDPSTNYQELVIDRR